MKNSTGSSDVQVGSCDVAVPPLLALLAAPLIGLGLLLALPVLGFVQLGRAWLRRRSLRQAMRLA